jgi:hypothetical protein
MDTAVIASGSRAVEPLHSMIYFAPETGELLARAGLRPGPMCYFAGRAAAMGAVGAEAVTAAFYNFNPDLVADNVPAAWALATPSTVVVARLGAADAALRRLLGDEVITSTGVAEAADLAARASEACTADGRPLYEGHARLEWPDEPHLRLWHAVTLLREFRGDGHVRALAAAGLSGAEALVAHVASGRGFRASFARRSRGWSDDQWQETVLGLRDRDLLDVDGNLTESGAALRAEVEAETDRLGAAPWRHLGQEGAARLAAIGSKLGRALGAAGAFPASVLAR